jgi:hypothetical protein
MTDTAMVPRKKKGDRPDGPAPLIDEQLADQLLGRALAEEMTGHLRLNRAWRGSFSDVPATSRVHGAKQR